MNNQATLPFLLILTMLSLGPALIQAAPQTSLTATQKATLKQAKSAFRRVGINVKLASSTAGGGTAPLTGSRAKLTRIRLGTSNDELKAVHKMLVGLPESDPDVADFLKEVAAAETSIESLQARLSGKSIPAATTPSRTGPTASSGSTSGSPQSSAPMKTKPTSASTKMSYRQVDQLKAAKFNLREVEGNVKTLQALVTEYQAKSDQLSIPFKRVRSGLAVLENAKRKIGFVADGLTGLPADGEGVSEVVARQQSATQSIEVATAYLLPLNRRLAKLVDPQNYPQLKTDLKRVRELAGMYGNSQILQTNLSQAAMLVKQSEASVSEAARIRKDYARLIQQQSEEGKQLANACDYFQRKHQGFQIAVQNAATALPKSIDKHLATAQSVAKRAVAEQKPLFFTGGIPQELGFASAKLELLQLIQPSTAAELQQKLKALQAYLEQSEQQLSRQIIESNRMPADNYRRPDRDQVIEVAVDAWKHQQKTFDLLATRIPSDVWARQTSWQYSNGTWYFVDQSKLAVHLVLADPDDVRLAIIRPVTIIKNHQKGDSLIGVPLWSIKDKLTPKSYLLRNKIK